MFRHELKFECSQADLALLRGVLTPILRLDAHAGTSGTYHIRSIYFDDPYDSCMLENVNGTQPREKWRIRAYNGDANHISLECKRKEHGMISKKSCRLTLEQYDKLIRGVPTEISDCTPALLNRFSVLLRTRKMEPKVIVGYDRTAFICKEGNVRITFDCDLFSSPDVDGFFSQTLHKRPVFSTGKALLEVKYDAYLPDYIHQHIQFENMRKTTFSKYFLCRQFYLI